MKIAAHFPSFEFKRLPSFDALRITATKVVKTTSINVSLFFKKIL